MTGRGRGFCVLRVPPDAEGALAGWAGVCGSPVGEPAVELDALRVRMAQVERGLRALRDRIERLEAGGT